MTRAEMILKVVLTPHDAPRQFVKNYLQFMNNDGDIGSFQKVLDMKGIRKPEQAHLIERLKKEHAAIMAAHQQQTTTQ
jgi:vacuolar protein sorting-associated protein 53